jgi:elongation factor P
MAIKTAHEVRAGNVILVDGQPLVVQKTEFSKSGRNSSVVKIKSKGLLSGSGSEVVYKSDDKMEVVVLDRLDCTYSYFADPMYVFMDEEFNQYEVEADNLGDTLGLIVDGMEDKCQVTFYDGKAISVELPTVVVREVEYTEPAVRGDTSGKVMKPAKLVGSEMNIQVAAFIDIGDKIEIDTRTMEFKKRAN